MPGFFVSNRNVSLKLINDKQNKLISEKIGCSNYTIQRNTLKKFIDDKCCYNDKEYIIIVEGYMLNKNDLYNEYGANNVHDLVINMYKKRGDKFFNEFRGGCSGCIYVKDIDKWLVWTNHTGDAPVFYYHQNDVIIFSSQVSYLLDALEKLNLNLNLDEQACYQMMTFAFMEGNQTYANEIKRLTAGKYILIDKGDLSVKEYHKFKFHADRLKGKTEEEIIDLIEKYFVKAIKLEYDKDIEYNYSHFADLSGGLDSRMGIWVANELGYKPVQCLTYCKADYLDEKIAKELARYWKFPLLVKQLDDKSFFYDSEKIIQMNNGLSLYSGITGGKDMLESLDTEKYGLEHTGMIGDVVLGSFYSSLSDAEKNQPSGKYSSKLVNRLTRTTRQEFDTHELYLLYTRGLLGATNTYTLRQNYTEVASPFMNVDFLQLCMDIPVELRIKHYIYRKWILTKHPGAGKFIWEKTGFNLYTNKLLPFLYRICFKGPRKLLGILGIHISFFEASSMNPFEYWYHNDAELRNRLKEEFYRNINYMPKETSETLKTDLCYLFESGNVNEKTMALTVVGACKQYFKNCNKA